MTSNLCVQAAEQAASADDAHVLPEVSVVWGAFFELPLRSCSLNSLGVW